MIDGPVEDPLVAYRRGMLDAALARWRREGSAEALDGYARAARQLARVEKAVAEFPTASELARRKERAGPAEGRP